jgi:hypothetical protein
MMNHEEIKSNTNLTDNQKEMLLCIDDYNEGWISEQDLEDKLSLILKLKVCGN